MGFAPPPGAACDEAETRHLYMLLPGLLNSMSFVDDQDRKTLRGHGIWGVGAMGIRANPM